MVQGSKRCAAKRGPAEKNSQSPYDLDRTRNDYSKLTAIFTTKVTQTSATGYVAAYEPATSYRIQIVRNKDNREELFILASPDAKICQEAYTDGDRRWIDPKQLNEKIFEIVRKTVMEL